MPRVRISKANKRNLQIAAARAGVTEDELADDVIRILTASDIRADLARVCEDEARGRRLTVVGEDVVGRPRIYQQIEDFTKLRGVLNA